MSGVAEICLELQEQLSLDVNIILFCFWGAHIKDIPTELQWEDIIEFSRDWKKNFVQPLRSVRDSLKREINNYPSTEDFETLRKRVKNDAALYPNQVQRCLIAGPDNCRVMERFG